MTLAAISPPALYSLGPNLGPIVNVVEVTADNVGNSLGYFDPTLSRQTNFSPPWVVVGQTMAASETHSNDLATALGGPDVQVYFRAFTITEEIPRYRQENLLLAAEEYIRPGWYGDLWTNQRVGEVWNELFSTGAITDPTTVNDMSQSSAGAQQTTPSTGDATGPSDPQRNAPGVADLQAGCSIRQAVDFLLTTYSYIKQQDADTDAFIGAYTWRPIATLIDIFGTTDLTYDSTGENVVQGFEGFHSRAVGPYNDLFGLVSAEIETVLGIKRGSTAAQKVDIRRERRDQVNQYLTALLFGSALLG
jgi:hypothetical protein